MVDESYLSRELREAATSLLVTVTPSQYVRPLRSDAYENEFETGPARSFDLLLEK